MDYLRQLSSALGKSGGPIPGIVQGEEVKSYAGKSIWRLYEGVRKDDRLPVSIFVFDTTHANPAQIAMAQNAVRKLRSVRFPQVLKFLDTAEVNGTLHLAVERITPLTQVLDGWRDGQHNASDVAWATWGLSHIANAVTFVNQQVHAIHGNIQPASVFVSQGGEWLLGGFEVLTTINQPDFLVKYAGQPLHSSRYFAPEVEAGWSNITQFPVYSPDSFAVGILAIEVFNGEVPSNPRNFPVGRIPPILYPLLKRITHPDSHARMSTADLITEGSKPGGFLSENELVQASAAVEEFRMADSLRKKAILDELETLQSKLIPMFSQYKVLPVLIEAFRSRPAPNGLDDGLELSTRVLLPLILRLGQSYDEARWGMVLGPPILEAFKTTYSPMRAALLSHMNLYATHLDIRSVANRIWPALASWFEDPHEVVRSALLAAIPLLIPKLSERILNNDLLRQLAKSQVDVQPSLRILSTQLLGQLTPHVTPHTRNNVLVAAFARSLKDNFEQARLSGIEAFSTNVACFDAEACARHVLPAISPCLVDKNREVREAATQTLHTYLEKIQSHAAGLSTVSTQLPTVSTEPETSESSSNQSSTFSFFSATAGQAASALSDWAIAQLDADETQICSEATAVPKVEPVSLSSAPAKQPVPQPLPQTSSSSNSPHVIAKPRTTNTAMTLEKKPQSFISTPNSKQSSTVPNSAPIRPNFGNAPINEPSCTPTSTTRANAPAQASVIAKPSSNAAPSTAPKPNPLPSPAISQPVRNPVPSNVSIASAPAKTPSAAMTAKMAELKRLREERKAVRA
ncbi:Nuclear aminoacylation-dependent tRNA export pathway component [Malassezia yamatoensis]|uniref:Nuclear aminoacylation-dependent tRNA export pathway component n=1 Tax=Malassezia yamatoensis TaxID=253288 RepID=A0AAJ6CJL8_9BASI|nr:Nuclear aminoacylation-dependent tRNA export pathway component [Malassezia yamatoensis]